jgi:hypothetical protein
MENESTPTGSEQPRYFVRQYEQTFTNWGERDEATGENPVETRTLWGVWKRGVEPATSQNEQGAYSGGIKPTAYFESEAEALAHVDELSQADEKREAEERRIAAEDAEDERKASALAAQGIVIPRHNPKVERLCKMIVRGDGAINYDHQKRALGIARQLLTPVEPEEEDDDDDDTLIAQYDPDKEEPEGRPTYKIMLTVTGSRLEATLKKAKVTFGSLLLNVEKVSRISSRADQMGEAVGMIQNAKSVCEDLKDQIESWKDNLPENFQDKASQLEECVDSLEQVISSLDEAEGNAESVEFPGTY